MYAVMYVWPISLLEVLLKNTICAKVNPFSGHYLPEKEQNSLKYYF